MVKNTAPERTTVHGGIHTATACWRHHWQAHQLLPRLAWGFGCPARAPVEGNRTVCHDPSPRDPCPCITVLRRRPGAATAVASTVRCRFHLCGWVFDFARRAIAAACSFSLAPAAVTLERRQRCMQLAAELLHRGKARSPRPSMTLQNAAGKHHQRSFLQRKPSSKPPLL